MKSSWGQRNTWSVDEQKDITKKCRWTLTYNTRRHQGAPIEHNKNVLMNSNWT
jgi:hypothetical protein